MNKQTLQTKCVDKNDGLKVIYIQCFFITDYPVQYHDNCRAYRKQDKPINILQEPD